MKVSLLISVVLLTVCVGAWGADARETLNYNEEWWFKVWDQVQPIRWHPDVDSFRRTIDTPASGRWNVLKGFGYGTYGFTKYRNPLSDGDPIDSLDAGWMMYQLPTKASVADRVDALRAHCRHLAATNLLESMSAKTVCWTVRCPGFGPIARVVNLASSWRAILAVVLTIVVVLASLWFCLCGWLRILTRILWFPFWLIGFLVCLPFHLGCPFMPFG